MVLAFTRDQRKRQPEKIGLNLSTHLVDGGKVALNGPFPLAGNLIMNNNLKSRREKLLRELDRVNREILWTQKDLVRIESRIVAKQSSQSKAA